MRAYCVFIGSLKSHLKSVSHIINVPRLLGLYGEIIGPPGLGSRDRAASSHSVYKISILKIVSSSDCPTPVLTLHYQRQKEYPFHSLNNPSEFLERRTSAKFVFLVILLLLKTRLVSDVHVLQQKLIFAAGPAACAAVHCVIQRSVAPSYKEPLVVWHICTTETLFVNSPPAHRHYLLLGPEGSES